MTKNIVQKRRYFRKKRARSKIGKGPGTKPRISVFRSNKHIYVQIIDDESGKTLFSARSSELKNKGTKSEKAKETGKRVAEKAVKAGVEKAVFDKGEYNYHGRVKALAEGAREAGLKF